MLKSGIHGSWIFRLFFRHSVMSDSLWPHGLQHARLPCPLSSSRACSNSCPLSQRFHLTISSSVIPFSSCFQYFPASGSFPVSQLFISGGQRIGASASASVLLMHIQDWLVWSRVFSNTTAQKHQFFSVQAFLLSNSHIHRYGTSIFSFVRSLHTVLCSDCLSLHCRQQCKRLTFSPHAPQQLSFADFFGNGHSAWCRVILHCSLISLFLILTDVESLFMHQWLLKPCACTVLSPLLSSSRQTCKNMEYICKNIHILSL